LKQKALLSKVKCLFNYEKIISFNNSIHFILKKYLSMIHRLIADLSESFGYHPSERLSIGHQFISIYGG